MKSKLQKTLFIFFILFLISISFVFSKFFAGLEVYSHDWKQSVALRFLPSKLYSPVRDKIVILSIEDLTSFDLSNHPELHLDRWPFSRKTWAEIIDFIEKGKPKTLSIAIPFQNYEDITLSANSSDLVFLSALKRYNNIVLGTILNSPETVSSSSPMTVLMDKIDNPYPPVKKSLDLLFLNKDFDNSINYYSYLPIPSMLVQNSDIAYMNLQKEKDTVVRYSQPVSRVINNNDTYYMPSFAFATFLKYIGYDKEIYVNKDRMYFDVYSVPLNEGADNYINWNGGPRTYDFVPLSKIIIGMKTTGKSFEYNKIKYPVDYFKDKIVIIAPTQTNSDSHNTSIYQGLTGAEIYANIIENYILDAKLDNPSRRKFIVEPPAYVSVLITLGVCLFIIGNTLFFRSSLLSLFNSVLIIVLYMLFDVYVFCHPKIRIDLLLIHPLYMMFVALISSYIYVLSEESAKKKEIVGIFGRFVSDNVLDKLLKNSNNFELKTDHKKVTVMFCDVSNFTSIMEKYPVDEVVVKLNKVFSVATEKIFKYQGTIDKLIGDAVMAYWGDPIPNANDSLNAVKAAVEIIDAIEELNSTLGEDDLKLDVKISINTGEALVGCIGSDKIADYTVVGDTVNIAARMEDICSQFNKKILISESTYREVSDFIRADYSGNINLKGKDESVSLYAPKLGKNYD